MSFEWEYEKRIAALEAQLAAYNTSGFADADAMASAYLDMRVRTEKAEAQVKMLEEALSNLINGIPTQADWEIARAALAATEKEKA